MSNIRVFNHSINKIGYIARTITHGEEYEMVKQYIDYYIKRKQKLIKKNIAIFIEPQIDTGYPDIVIVDYYNSKDKSWIEERSNITNNDLKILFEIQKKQYVSISELEYLLGFSKDELDKAINRLSQCHLIKTYKHSKNVRSVRLDSYCRINNIIAIEAKVDKWNEAIRQATNNTWFSTESYILMKKDKLNDEILNKCKERGIGVLLMNGNITCSLKSEKRKMPVSYSSLQFNEWIMKSNFQDKS